MTRGFTRAVGPLATLVALRQAAVLALTAMLVLALSPLNTDALAQGRRTGTVRGNVTDAQGLVMPGVTVNFSSPAMQGRRSTFTDLNGNYEALGLPPGDYTVVFELDGFADVENMATVPLGGTIAVNGSMTPGGVSETVQVVAVVPSPIATTENASNVDSDEINALPMGRNPFRIAEMQPGLTDNTPNAGQVTINGSFAYDNIFLMDGVDINDNLFGTANNLFIEDAIEETQVLTSGDLGRVWAVLRRCHQRHHEERRQYVLGELPVQSLQAPVDQGDALRGRCGQRSRRQPQRQHDLRDDRGRSDRAGSPLVLLCQPGPA